MSCGKVSSLSTKRGGVLGLKAAPEFSVPIRRHNHVFLTRMFYMPLWRTIKNSGRAGIGQEDRLEKIITKSKRNKNLKMPSFCAVFNYSNCAD